MAYKLLRGLKLGAGKKEAGFGDMQEQDLYLYIQNAQQQIEQHTQQQEQARGSEAKLVAGLKRAEEEVERLKGVERVAGELRGELIGESERERERCVCV
jgi:hypothetical protein